MLRKLGLVDLMASIQHRVEQSSELRCYDAVPQNARSPFYIVEVVGKRPADTKTMFCEVFSVWIHAIAELEDSNGSVGVYNMVEVLEEAMTEDIELPEDFNLILQSNIGIQTIKLDETMEKHAVLAYEFKVSYGFKVKV